MAHDFHAVLDRHQAIHERLRNWGRAQHGHGSASVAPMFRGYRSPEHWVASEASVPIDLLDASQVNKGVVMLPEKHRLSLHWCYVHPWVPVFRARKAMGVTEAALWELIGDSRSMLVNRRI